MTKAKAIDYSKEATQERFDKLSKKRAPRAEYLRDHKRKEYAANPEKFKARSKVNYQKKKTKQVATHELLMGRWNICAKDLLSRSPSPTMTDLKIVGILAYTMDISSSELMKFLSGVTPELKTLNQIRQWLDFRQGYCLEHELPEDIRNRHKLVNANYDRIVQYLNDSTKDIDGQQTIT